MPPADRLLEAPARLLNLHSTDSYDFYLTISFISAVMDAECGLSDQDTRKVQIPYKDADGEAVGSI